jgi:NADH pyrophosphatase NudC (nudix superfamily)
MHFAPHTLVLLGLTTGPGYLMVFAGLGKNALEWRRRRRICPSCGRQLDASRACSCSS